VRILGDSLSSAFTMNLLRSDSVGTD